MIREPVAAKRSGKVRENFGRRGHRLRLPRAEFILVILVFLTAQAQENTVLHLEWRSPLESNEPPIGTPAILTDKFFVANSGIQAYSLNDGHLLWHSPVHQYLPRNLVTSKNMVFVPEAVVTALNAQTGSKVWEFTPDGNTSLGRALADDDAVYFGTSSHRLYALQASDGRKLWEVELGKEWKFPAVVRGIAIFDKTVYAAVEQWRTANGNNSSGLVFAVDARTGKIEWSFSTGSGMERRGFSSSPSVTSRLVVVADYLSNAIVAIDRRRRREIWRFQAETGFVGFPEAPIVIGNVVYAASGDTYVYALDLNTGHLLWRTRTPAANQALAMCGSSLLVNYQGLAALDPATGRILQTMFTDDGESITSDFAIAGKRAFVAGPKAVYAFTCR